MSTAAAASASIHPFQIDIPQEKIDELRRRIAATRWPSKELVADRSQGVQLEALQALARYWGRVRLRAGRGAPERAAAVHDSEIDGVDIHFIHVTSSHEDALPLIMTHGWPGSVIELLDSVGPLDGSDRARRQRPGRLPSRAALPAGVRALRRAGSRLGLGSGPDGTGLGRADAPTWLHPLRGPGRRRRRRRHRRDGSPGTRRSGRHPHQPARAGARRRRCRRTQTRSAPRPRRSPPSAVRKRLLRRDGHPAADDRLCPARLTDRPGRLDGRPRHGRLLQDRARVRRPAGLGQPHARPHPRQHHAVLADRHRRLRRPLVLGGLRS